MEVKDLRARYSAGGNSIIPNSFQCPNYFVDNLMSYLTPEENTVLFYAIRRILGFQDNIISRKDKISLSQFTDGIVSKKDGSILSRGCGLGIQAVRKALDGLETYKVLVPTTDKPDFVNGQEYWLQDQESAIDMDGLEKRLEDRKKIAKYRTKKATSASIQKRSITSDVTPKKEKPYVPRNTSLTSHVIPGVSSDVNTKPTETQGNTLSESELKSIIEASDKELAFLLKQNQLAAGRSWTKLPEIYHSFGKAVCGATGLEYTKRNFHEWVSTFEDWMAQRCQPVDVVKAMEVIKSEGKVSWISSPRSLTHWVIGQKTARLSRENKAIEIQASQDANTELPAWMKADYENVG